MIITIDTGQTFPFSWPKLRQLSTREKKCQKGQKLTDQLSFPKIPIPSSVYVIETILSCSFRLSSEDKQARYCNSASPNLTLTDKLNLLLNGGHSDTNIIQQNLLLLLPLSLSLQSPPSPPISRRVCNSLSMLVRSSQKSDPLEEKP